MIKFKVGDTVCFEYRGEVKIGKLVRVNGIFKKECLIEYKGIAKKNLYLTKEKYIYKTLETIKEPVSKNEVQND
ncbi:hypothetical protein I7E32_16350 [Alcaligenes faecalis]|nr:hypothetical protein [Alcaligenes faecalis]